MHFTTPSLPRFLETHSRPVVVEEFNPGLFKHRYDPSERIGTRANSAVEALHPLNRSERYPPFSRELRLGPT